MTFEPLDFDDFHTGFVPRLAAVPEGLKPLAFSVEDRAYTFVPEPPGLRVIPGSSGAATVVALEHADWQDFVWELRTSFALLYASRLTFPTGHFGHLAAWEPALRAAFSGDQVFSFEDALSPSPSLSLEDDDGTIAGALETAGYVHLRGVYASHEVAAIAAEVDTGVERARPDDKRSWWTTVDGADVCNRVNYLNEISPLIASLGADPRMQRIGALAGPSLRECSDRLDGHSVVIKVPGATTGLADLPWHRDCGMGGHPVKCPMLNVGIQLDAATAASGQLHVLPGSHRGNSGLPRDADVAGLSVALDTEPGDVTVHFGHTLHAAPPPADRAAAGRRALYLSYVTPLTFEMVPPGQGYNDVLFERDAGHVRHVDELR